MFTLFYKNKFYIFIKSGLLLDFYFKRLIFNFLWIFYLYYNIFFSEKYFIEYNFLKVLLYFDFLKNIKTVYSQYFSIYQIGVIWLIVIFLLILMFSV